ncbi:MAG: hypothetical protein K2K11_07310 [Bacteroidales bacterium]|nr:hypothetical protein [Bacteroidales bacterium]MDE7338308.1 hypothetical protein [Bacteroidales bacterium]
MDAAYGNTQKSQYQINPATPSKSKAFAKSHEQNYGEKKSPGETKGVKVFPYLAFQLEIHEMAHDNRERRNNHQRGHKSRKTQPFPLKEQFKSVYLGFFDNINGGEKRKEHEHQERDAQYKERLLLSDYVYQIVHD